MAIHVFCTTCKTSNALDAVACSKCGKKFSRGKKYRVCVSHKGERVTRVVDNLTIARGAEVDIKADLQRKEFDIKDHKAEEKPLTLGELWEKHYAPWAQEHKKSWNNDLHYYLKHIEPRFAKKPLEEITALDIERMKLELKKGLTSRGKPYSAQTIKHQIVIIRRLFNLAVKWGLYSGANPVTAVQVPKVDNQKTEFLTDEEADRLLKTLEEWPCRESAAFVKFAMFSGLRRGEIIKLTWNDLDFERGMVTLRDPKGGKTQTVPLSNEALSAVRELDIAGEHVFPGKSGGERYDFKGPWQRIRKAAELPEDFRFHGLRHHFASTLVSNGVDLAVVKELLTHKDMATTQRYAHLAPDAVKRAALRSGELLTGKKKADVIPLQGKGK